MTADRKEAERAYPELIEESGREWLRTKPFANSPRETARLLIDFGYIVQLLELQPGMSICELGCGPGWMTRMFARHGLEAVGYDISPGMIEIARGGHTNSHSEHDTHFSRPFASFTSTGAPR